MNRLIFEHPVYLYYNDFDRFGKVKVSSLLHFMSDVAGIHYASKGYSYDRMKEQHQVFLLSSVRLVIEEQPKQDTKVTVRTWEGDIKGAAFVRYFEILDEKGNTLVKAASNWMLVDPISRKLLRPKDFMGVVEPAGMENAEILPQRIKPQTETLQFTTHSVREIRFTDLDQNDHLYNAKYADMIYDALAPEYTSEKLADFQIHFRREVVLGDELRIGYEIKEDGLYVAGQLTESREVCFAAKMKFEKI